MTLSQDTVDSYPCEARNNKKIRQHRQSIQVTQTTALQQSVDSVTDLRVLAQVLFAIQNVQ